MAIVSYKCQSLMIRYQALIFLFHKLNNRFSVGFRQVFGILVEQVKWKWVRECLFAQGDR